MCNKCKKVICSCEREVISPVGKRGGDGPRGPKGESLPAWWYKAILVDFTHGDNAKAIKYSNTIPFKTYDAARLAATTGDTIVFMPGEHEVDTELLTGDGIRIWAMPQSIIYVNNAQVATAGILNIQGDGEWHFYNDGINIDDTLLENSVEHIFTFKDLYVHYSYGLSSRIGDIKIKGGNIYIVDQGSTFLYLNNWIGRNCDIEFDKMVDNVVQGDSSEFSSNIYIRASIGEDISYSNITFKKIVTKRRQCIVYLSDDTTEFRTTTRGDIEQVSDTGADVMGNCTIYVSSTYISSHNLYGRYRANTPNCIVAVSSAGALLPMKVYHEGSIDMQDSYGVMTLAGMGTKVKLRGIYAAGQAAFSAANETITVGVYNGWNILLPGGGITTGGNLEVIGTIINRHNGDSNEVTCIYGGGDTDNTTTVRLNNAKLLWTVTTGAQLAMWTETTQILEVIGEVQTNFEDGIENQFVPIGTALVEIDDFTDDQIF